MNAQLASTDGYISFRGYNTWYRIVGENDAPGKFPLVLLHGGPGAGHDYLEPLQAMAETGRRVIFYDQLGTGKSAHPSNPALWTIELFLDELRTLRNALGLEKVHLLGQSWGGMLALEHALSKATGIASLILADTLASIPHFVTEVTHLREALPADIQATLAKHEAEGTTEDPAYQEAMMVFYTRHVCRLDPWPDPLMRTLENVTKYPEVYATMWGPSEFFVTGTLKTWDISKRLGEIRVPTLVLGGRYDEVTPAVTTALHGGIAESEYMIFENSAHMPHLEETEAYVNTLTAFLDRVEARV
jgi:proline-specific peptidase